VLADLSELPDQDGCDLAYLEPTLVETIQKGWDVG